MANYQSLKTAINAVIKANGNKEITGTVLNEVLLAMVNSLGAGYQFAGVATPSTNPGTPDQKVFYIASQAGTYNNFNGAVVSDGIVIFEWNGTWTTETLDLSMAGQVQSDWTETDTTKKSYIKHKPNIPPSANVDPVPTEDSPNAVSSGGTYDMIVNTAATLFGDIQDATNVNAIESVDGKIYNDYQAGDIFFIVDNNVRKYRVALVAGTADAEHPVTISPVNFYYALNSADAINLSLTLKTVSTEQQSLSSQQKAQARTNIAAVSYEQQSLDAGQQVQAQNNMMGKAYSPVASDHSGLGKVYLDKNNGVLTQAMISQTNTEYVIMYDFTLGEDITVPADCVLEFDGGSISGDGNNKNTITGNNLRIDGNDTVLKDMYIVATGSCEIKNLTINYTNAIKDSISVTNATHVDIKNVNINIDANDYRVYEADGIHIENSSNITVDNCIIVGTKSHYSDSNQGSIYISDSANISITRCTAKNAKAECLNTQGCTSVNYENCYVENCSGSAISSDDDDTLRISAVTAIGTGASAFSINSDNCNIANCLLKNNALFNAITLGHADYPVKNAHCTNNTIITEQTAFGGVVVGDVVISGNNIVAKCAFNMDNDGVSKANFLVTGNTIVEEESTSRLSLSGWNVALTNNIFKNCKFIGDTNNAQFKFENNTFCGYTGNITAFSNKAELLIFNNNYFYNCDFDEIEANTGLIKTNNAKRFVATNNILIDESQPTKELYWFQITNPQDATFIGKNNQLTSEKFDLMLMMYKGSAGNNKVILENNRFNSNKSGSMYFVNDGFTTLEGHDNIFNNQYRYINPDYTLEPDVILVYDESSFSRLQSTSVAKIVRDINNTNTVNARKCLDFTSGCKILGDVNLNNTRIIPNGCKISDYIQGTITGTYAVGQCLYDETLGKPKWYNGTNWVDASGNVIS